MLSTGPPEHGHRPAVDTLFRSAAHTLGPRVTGVILSGMLDDGSAGMVAIASRGGTTIVQEPGDALYRGMPDSVLNLIEPDHVLPATKIGGVLAELAGQDVDPAQAPGSSPLLAAEVDMAWHADQGRPDLTAYGDRAGLICPSCDGPLVEIVEQGTPRYRCHVGHGWAAQALLVEQAMAAERALWTALRTFEERGTLARRMAAVMGGIQPVMRDRYEQLAAECAETAAALRTMLLSGMPEHREPPGADHPE